MALRAGRSSVRDDADLQIQITKCVLPDDALFWREGLNAEAFGKTSSQMMPQLRETALIFLSLFLHVSTYTLPRSRLAAAVSTSTNFSSGAKQPKRGGNGSGRGDGRSGAKDADGAGPGGAGRGGGGGKGGRPTDASVIQKLAERVSTGATSGVVGGSVGGKDSLKGVEIAGLEEIAIAENDWQSVFRCAC